MFETRKRLKEEIKELKCMLRVMRRSANEWYSRYKEQRDKVKGLEKEQHLTRDAVDMAMTRVQDRTRDLYSGTIDHLEKEQTRLARAVNETHNDAHKARADFATLYIAFEKAVEAARLTDLQRDMLLMKDTTTGVVEEKQ